MKAKQLLSTLTTLLKARLPVLLTGRPGGGKTQIFSQAAKAAGLHLIISHPVVSDPTDYKGMPAIVKGMAEFLPFGDLRQLIEAKEPTVFFADDVGQSSQMTQAALMQLFLGRQVNGHRISDHVVFGAATNRRQDRAGVSSILAPLRSRFHSIIELEPSHADWCEWASRSGVPHEVIAFVRFRPIHLDKPEELTSEIANQPSPRTITNMADLFRIGIRDVETLAGAVGTGFAGEFVTHLKVYQDVPTIDEILEEPRTARVPSSRNPAAMYAVATLAASAASRKNGPALMTYLARLPDEFTMLGVKDMVQRDEASSDCPEFTKWGRDHSEFFL